MAELPSTIYLNEQDRAKHEAIAKKLAEKGVRNLYKKNGDLNRSALIRFVMNFVDKAINLHVE